MPADDPITYERCPDCQQIRAVQDGAILCLGCTPPPRRREPAYNGKYEDAEDRVRFQLEEDARLEDPDNWGYFVPDEMKR